MSDREGHLTIEPSGLKFHDTVAHLIAKGLNRHGVDLVFGYRTENAGGYMAVAYA